MVTAAFHFTDAEIDRGTLIAWLEPLAKWCAMSYLGPPFELRAMARLPYSDLAAIMKFRAKVITEARYGRGLVASVKNAAQDIALEELHRAIAELGDAYDEARAELRKLFLPLLRAGASKAAIAQADAEFRRSRAPHKPPAWVSTLALADASRDHRFEQSYRRKYPQARG